jgi:hypothetical protein
MKKTSFVVMMAMAIENSHVLEVFRRLLKTHYISGSSDVLVFSL